MAGAPKPKPEPKPAFLALRERAHALLVEHGSASDAELLAHVFGGTPPPALADHLLRPLLSDPRLTRAADGRWALAGRPSAPATGDLTGDLTLTSLAIAATGPRPTHHRVLQLAALHVVAGRVVGRFEATFNPGCRVPAYVARRAGVGESEVVLMGRSLGGAGGRRSHVRGSSSCRWVL